MEEVKVVQLIYEGKDITRVVDIKKADIIDNAGGIADSLEIELNDTLRLWSDWKPKKNHRIELKYRGFNSGQMYVDELDQKRGLFIIKALSIPQEAKTYNTKAWENVRFLEFATEIALKYGFELRSYGIQNYLYERVDQYEQADFEFLAWRCTLEGYMLKITDGKVVIYDEKYMEQQAPAKVIYLEQLDGDYRFRTKATDIFSSCIVSYGSIRYQFNAPGVHGPELKLSDIYITNLGEAERFSRNLLRFKNKHENVGYGIIEIETGIAAGNNVQIQGVGLADGKHFCEQIIHSIVNNKTFLKLRKPLEGY